MLSEKTRPILTKTSKTKSTSVGLKALIALIMLLIIIVIGYFFWPRPLPNSPAMTKDIPTETEQTQAAQSAAMTENIERSDDNNNSRENNTVTAQGTEMTDLPLPKAAAILNAPLPATDSLAKEEIDRLEDQQQRLAEKEKLAAEQITMSQELTDMKAEQIALLEEQIAKLEATKQAEASAE